MKNESVGPVRNLARGRELNNKQTLTPKQQQEHMQVFEHL